MKDVSFSLGKKKLEINIDRWHELLNTMVILLTNS